MCICRKLLVYKMTSPKGMDELSREKTWKMFLIRQKVFKWP